MFTPYLLQAAAFLIELAFNLCLLAVLLRLLLQFVKADFYNPFSQLLVKVTQPLLGPLRRVLPSLGRLDSASLLLLLLLVVAEIYLLSGLAGHFPNPLGVLIYGIGKLLSLLLSTYSIMLIALAISSWFMPQGYHPLLGLLQQLTEPLLRPVRNLLPPLGGIDLSLLAVLVILQLMMILFVGPLTAVGSNVMGGATLLP